MTLEKRESIVPTSKQANAVAQQANALTQQANAIAYLIPFHEITDTNRLISNSFPLPPAPCTPAAYLYQS